MISHVESNLREARACLDHLLNDRATLQKISDAGGLLAQTFRDGGRLYSCGNGGSMCDAMHLAEELTGRFRKNRKPIGAMAISDVGHISCTANDFGYDSIFSRFIEGHGRKGDVLVCISTSGKSPNIIAAAKVAKDLGLSVLGLTGKEGSELGALVDIDLCTPGGRYADRVQELHIKVIHTLVELVERVLFNEVYA